MKWNIEKVRDHNYVKEIISQKEEGEINVYQPLINIKVSGQYEENLVLELGDDGEIVKVVEFSSVLKQLKHKAPIEKIELARTDKNRFIRVYIDNGEITIGKCFCCNHIINYKAELLNEINKRFGKNLWFGNGGCERLEKIDRNTYILTRILGESHHDINPPERILYCYDRYNAIIVFKDENNYDITLNFVGMECN